MSEHTPSNVNAPKFGAAHATRKLRCEEWEALLVDFLDGALATGDAAEFHAHRESCAACGEMFAHAGQGREWLGFLRAEPPAPATLVIEILAQTSGADGHAGNLGLGAELTPVSAEPAAVPFWKDSGMALATRRFAQPRMLMTAAMAFFSITLSLNMAGVRLSAVRLSDLKPATLGTNLNKQYHMASARVVRYYDNWRFLYEMEARVRELRRDADLDDAAPADRQPQTAPSGNSQDGSHKNGGGKSQAPNDPAKVHTRALAWGEKVEAAFRNPSKEFRPFRTELRVWKRQSRGSIVEDIDSRAADQPERGIA